MNNSPKSINECKQKSAVVKALESLVMVFCVFSIGFLVVFAGAMVTALIFTLNDSEGGATVALIVAGAALSVGIIAGIIEIFISALASIAHYTCVSAKLAELTAINANLPLGEEPKKADKPVKPEQKAYTTDQAVTENIPFEFDEEKLEDYICPHCGKTLSLTEAMISEKANFECPYCSKQVF